MMAATNRTTIYLPPPEPVWTRDDVGEAAAGIVVIIMFAVGLYLVGAASRLEAVV